MLCDVYFLFVFSPFSLSLSLSLFYNNTTAPVVVVIIIIINAYYYFFGRDLQLARLRCRGDRLSPVRYCISFLVCALRFALLILLHLIFGCCSAWAGHVVPGRWCGARFRHQRQSTFVERNETQGKILEQQSITGRESQKSTRRI